MDIGTEQNRTNSTSIHRYSSLLEKRHVACLGAMSVTGLAGAGDARAGLTCFKTISGPPRYSSRGNMEQRIRAASAAIAFAHALGREVLSVYEHEGRRYNRISVRVTGSIINGYDFESECHVAGALPSIYHFGAESHWLLRPNCPRLYNGLDYCTSTPFSVRVTDNGVQIGDWRRNSFTYNVWWVVRAIEGSRRRKLR
ncbi:hypothetical protein ABIA06_002976 [Bradyrhizobium yuanmingense]